MKNSFIISAVLVPLFVSCSVSKKVNMPGKPLYETIWALQKIYTDAGIEEVQTKAFIKFDEQKKNAGGNGSCNSFGSTTTIHNNEIGFKDIFSTKMYCQEVQKIEDSFFKKLEMVDRFEITGNSLLLYQGEKMVLEFASK